MAFDGIDRRPLFKTSPFSYSELFFLDEATAYASGHRPCNDCRRPALLDFKQFWGRANFPDISPSSITVTKIDSQLHLERIRKDHSKVTYPDRIGSLPTGVMFAYAKKAYLSHEGRVLEWTPSGYVRAELAADQEVEVLTPRSIVEAIRLGLAVELHGSANK